MELFKDFDGKERRRLNRRIHSISATRLARDLAKYRKYVCMPSSRTERGVGLVRVEFEGRVFHEPIDLLPILHNWLDQKQVPTLQS